MSANSPHQLLLLADHLKLSLLERQRAIALNLDPNKQDAQISRSLTNLQNGIEQLSSQNPEQDETPSSDLSKLRQQYSDVYAQFHGAAPPAPSSDLRKPNDPSLASDFTAARSTSSRRNKNVRFRDNPNAPESEIYHDDDDGDEDGEPDAQEAANRAALFSDPNGRYRDDPDDAGPPDQSALDNQQIHAYHTQVLRDQDEQLDTLGQSIGRQRMLGIQMGNELDDQNAFLDDVESGVDRHATTLQRARRNLGQVARKSKENWSWVTIGVLIVILVLLIVITK